MPMPLAIPEEHEQAFIEDYLDLEDQSKLAEKWGISSRTAQRTLKRLGVKTVKPRTSPVWTHPGLGVKTDLEVAALTGVSQQRVYAIRKELGIPCAPRRYPTK